MRFRVCSYVRPEEDKVNPHLAITPTDMEQMSLQHKAIASNVNENNISFNGNQTSSLPIEFQRGVTLNTIYEAGLRSRRKIEQFGKKFMHKVDNPNLN